MDKYKDFDFEKIYENINILYLNDEPMYTLKKIDYNINFDNEVNILKLLNTLIPEYVPNIIDYFTHNEDRYIVYKYIDGQDLYDFMDQNYSILPDKKKSYICMQIIYIIKKLHNYGIFHRDIKLENFVINNDLKVTLIDFGVACLYTNIEDDDPIIPGSILTLSQEYIKFYIDRANVTFCRDDIMNITLTNEIYSICVIIYLIYNDSYPYDGNDNIRYSPNYIVENAIRKLYDYEEIFIPSIKIKNKKLKALVDCLFTKNYIDTWKSITG